MKAITFDCYCLYYKCLIIVLPTEKYCFTNDIFLFWLTNPFYMPDYLEL